MGAHHGDMVRGAEHAARPVDEGAHTLRDDGGRKIGELCIGGVAGELPGRAGYETKQCAQTDKEKIAADERIKTLEAKRDVLVAEGGSCLNAIMRAGFGIPPMIYLGKLYLFDKVLGWGATDPLSPELWNVLWTVVGFYFLDQIAGRVTRRK